MPRVDRLRVELTTSEIEQPGAVGVEFNGHVLPAESEVGHAATGVDFAATYYPRSMAHSIRLLGPASGRWTIRRCRVEFDTGLEPYAVEFEPFVLEAGESASLWAERPTPLWDV